MTVRHPAEMGTWTLGGQSMIWVGGAPLNLEVLYSAEQIEWDNVEQPGVDGELPRDPWVVPAEFEVWYHLSGTVLSDGTATSLKMAAFLSNYAKLRTLVGLPSTWGGSSVTSVITPQGGAPLTAEVQVSVSPWDHEAAKASGSVMPCTVTVVVPKGAHA